MRPCLIGGLAVAGDTAGQRCTECHEQIWLAPIWDDFIEERKPLLVCITCATDFFEGEVTADMHPVSAGVVTSGVFISAAVVNAQPDAAKRDLALYASPNLSHELSVHRGEIPDPQGMSSPLWVKCPKCAAYRGDPCHTNRVSYCPQRIEENLLRLEALETYGTLWHTPCHQAPIWLVWRTAGNELSWCDVPCAFKGCDMTYSVNLYADDLVNRRVPTSRVNPGCIEMCCWATEETSVGAPG